MPRQVVTLHDVQRFRSAPTTFGMAGGVAAAPAAIATPKPDTFLDRLLKYIPAEVVTVYVFLDGVLRSAPTNVPIPVLRWAVFVCLLVGTWFYLERVGKVTKKQQLAISTVAFAVWVFSLGGPFASYPWYSPVYGALLLPLYTFAIPIVEPTS